MAQYKVTVKTIAYHEVYINATGGVTKEEITAAALGAAQGEYLGGSSYVESIQKVAAPRSKEVARVKV